MIKDNKTQQLYNVAFFVMCFIAIYAVLVLDDFIILIAVIIRIAIRFAMASSDRKKRMRLFTETRDMCSEKKYIVSKDGLLYETVYSKTVYSWDDLYGVRTDYDFIYIYYNSYLAYGIPKEKLSEDEIAFILDCGNSSVVET